MKATGIIRPIDNFGRVVIPVELRETMKFNKKDPMEIFVEEDKIILKKYEPACVFCGSADDVIEYEGKMVCKKCLKNMQENI